ncbi:MAG: hypothetical protein ACLR01_00140 [Vescimonas sp.]
MSTLMMPPSPQGTVQEQLVRQYSYLFQMAQQLNVALGQLESGGTAAPSGGTAAPAAEREQQYQTLKSMIVKTADTVQRRMDQLSAKLTGSMWRRRSSAPMWSGSMRIWRRIRRR